MKFKTKEEREQFIIDNLGLVTFTLKNKMNYEYVEYSYEDIFNVGVIGLIKGIDKFDEKISSSFSSYIIKHISGEIHHYTRESRQGIRYGQRLLNNRYKINKLSKSMSNKEISQELGMSEKEIEEIKGIDFKILSLNRKYKDSDFDNEFEYKFGYHVDFDTELYLESLFSVVSELEKEIILERFINEKTQYNIGLNHGLSQAQISRIIKGGLAKMRNAG